MIVFVVHYMSSALDDVAGLVVVVSLEARYAGGRRIGYGNEVVWAVVCGGTIARPGGSTARW